jgi:serine/threonine protein phosphatase PrpC
MEDAHLIHISEDWAFFGVFDGHGGDACANFVAPRLGEELKKGCPADDQAVRKMLFEVDDEFLKTDEEGGSTATMCIVHKPKEKGGKHRLRVINSGDSRILLGKRSGEIVDGGGSDQGLTTDHKPDHPPEKERIEAAGESVVYTFGNCARVSGNLAVCRGFGDKKYKTSKNREHSDKPDQWAVTVDPELKEFECDEDNFIVLVCDGVSEGDFSNSEVIQLIASELKATKDLGAAARAVCHKAVKQNSKDNISCMVVTLDGEKESEKQVEFRSGSIDKLNDKAYCTAYEAMAKRAKLTLAESVENRHDMLASMLKEESTLKESDVVAKVGRCEMTDDGKPDLKEFKDELDELIRSGEVPGELGSPERRDFFDKWTQLKISSSA